MGKVFGLVVKTSASHIRAHGISPGLQPQASADAGTQQGWFKVTESLPPTWETWIQFPAPGFGPGPLWPLQVSGEYNSG